MKDDFEFLRGLANCQDKEQMARYIEDHHPKPMTNADRIRAMNDEEMIELLKEFSAFSCIFPDKDCGEVSCVECVTKWLKQPVEDSR